MALMRKYQLNFVIYLIGIVSMGIGTGIWILNRESKYLGLIVVSLGVALVCIAFAYGDRYGLFKPQKEVINNDDNKR